MTTRVAPRHPGRTAALGGLLGATALLLGLLAIPSHAVSAGNAMRVQAIRVSESDGDTQVVIAASARPTFTTFKLAQPPRVVVDISGARLGELDVPFDANTYAVGAISANASDDDSGVRTRVVLTLRQPSDCRFEAHGNDIVVRVVPNVRARPAPTALKGEAPAKAARAAAEDRKASADARAAADQARAAAEAEGRKLAEERARTEEA